MRRPGFVLLLVLPMLAPCRAQSLRAADDPFRPAALRIELLPPERQAGQAQRRSSIPDPSSAFPRAPARPTALAAALERAHKKGVVESAVEGYTEVLIACQKEQSPALTTPFMRADSQQAHCFRF